MFGINGSEFIVLLAVAAVVLGPERLPHYSQQLARLVRELRRMAQGASEQVRAELGPEFDEIDWQKLDPRQYDPRRIVREALADTWNPDDPLGLGEKPLSFGGPGSLGLDSLGLGRASAAEAKSAARSGATSGSAESVVAEAGGQAGAAEVPIDPDAT